MSFDECYLKSVIRAVPNWPEDGVTFRDVAPLFLNPKALHMVADSFSQHYMDSDITHIASLDARGFLIGSIVAYKLNLPLILIRKKGKLPGQTLQEEYSLEYGTATVEIQQDACSSGDKVLILDDLIATGGSILAASTLIRKLGAQVTEAAAIIDLPDLQGSVRLQEADIPVHTLIAY
ncbi:adenine phosphoribosyltransferase [Motiliproteus sp. MSK22-1]|uniref:adenine phosphoribosyltransferase n=1 Tax=Motiliproteus sp. MSK22-1 TaxID=1897630 RepID=UPI0009762477|nr:adenine phosphoribosyltransferase [Motiliproteus sp. MSK22-1]OMH38756.1 adenine phosphoribosyltransferase [Motiliproteus sp. MSK22-1]